MTTSHRIDEARELQYDLLKLFDVMIYSAEFPEGFRAAVQLRGFRMGRGRQPLSEEQRTDLQTLSQELQCMLSSHGFTNEPVGGCPPAEEQSSVESEEVTRLVSTVVAELKRRGMVD